MNRQVMLEIDVPKDANVGAPLGDISINNEEEEFLFAAGTPLEVTDIIEDTIDGEPKRIKCRALNSNSEGKKKPSKQED